MYDKHFLADWQQLEHSGAPIGYILHTSPTWLDKVQKLGQMPVYWGKTPQPSSGAITSGTYLFFRKSREVPGVVKAYGRVSLLKTSIPLQDAWKMYGARMGYDSMEQMIQEAA